LGFYEKQMTSSRIVLQTIGFYHGWEKFAGEEEVGYGVYFKHFFVFDGGGFE